MNDDGASKKDEDKKRNKRPAPTSNNVSFNIVPELDADKNPVESDKNKSKSSKAGLPIPIKNYTIYTAEAGPSPEITPEVLAALKRQNIRRVSVRERDRRLSQFSQRENEAASKYEARMSMARARRDSNQSKKREPEPKLPEGILEIVPVRQSYLPKKLRRRRRRRKKHRKASNISEVDVEDEEEDQVCYRPSQIPSTIDQELREPRKPRLSVEEHDDSSSDSGSSDEAQNSQAPRRLTYKRKSSATEPEEAPVGTAEKDSEEIVFLKTKEIKDEYNQIKSHVREKAELLHEEEMARRKAYDESHSKPVYEPITPAWLIELEKGAEHLEKHRRADLKVKKKAVKAEEEDLNKRPIYVTSGASDMSFDSLPTVCSGHVPEFLSPGLRYFNGIDKLLLQHQVYHRDAVMKCNDVIENTFILLNASGHKVYTIVEKRKGHGCCRSSEMTATAYYDGLQAIRLKYAGCGFRYKRRITVFSPEANLLGTVGQKWSLTPSFEILDHSEVLQGSIQLEDRRFCGLGPAAKKIFLVTSAKGDPLGEIRGNSTDLTYHLYLTHDLFGIFFKPELGVIMKSLIMGAAMLIYKTYFDGTMVKKVIYDPKDSAREYYAYENFLAHHPSYQSSVGTFMNWECPPQELIRIDQ